KTRSGVSREQALLLAASLAQGSLHPVSKALTAAHETTASPGLALISFMEMKEIAGQGMEAELSDGGRLRLGSASFCGVAQPVDEADATPMAHLADQEGWLA